MKHITLPLLLLTFFVLMLCVPQETFAGATYGLLLWYRTIVPTLLPFVIITSLLIQTNSITLVTQIAGPLIQRCFRVSPSGSFAVIVGFLCGYPMGAKVTADLLRQGFLTHSEAQYLLSFCNNASPMFIISYLVLQTLNNRQLTLSTLLLLLATPLLCTLLFRRFHQPQSSAVLHTADAAKHLPFSLSIVDVCITNACETLVKIGGYMMLFSILAQFIQVVFRNHLLLQCILLPFFEITTGIPFLVENYSHATVTYPLVCFFASFGGLCSIAQTASSIQNTPLSIKPYITEKLITASVTSLLALLYLQL